MNLSEKVAIITGASSGIGEAIAWELARLDVKLILAARRLDRLKKTAEALRQEGATAVAIKTDITDRNQVESMVKVGLREFGRVDILINNAGIMPLSFMKNLHVDEWESMIDVNVKGPLYAIAAVLPHMRGQRQGHIINISSVAGRRLFPAGAVYCGTKFALNAISEGLRNELTASAGIRVTTIEPGAVATELTQTITDREVMEHFKDYQNMKMLEPSDIARSVSYALTQPNHVDVAEVMVLPSDQK